MSRHQLLARFYGSCHWVNAGRVAILFEGGCWDKLVSFKLEEVEKAPAPQGMNPKSATLEPVPDLEQAEAAEKPAPVAADKTTETA